VLLADDHDAVRRNMRLLLDAEDDVEVIAEAADTAGVLLELLAHEPHVLAFDPRIDEGSGIESIRSLRSRVPETEILVLTMEASGVLAHHALRAGAIGFVLKDTADRELAEAVRHAISGQQYVSARVAAVVAALSESDARASLYDAT
jgi:two-component system response regulator NreC